MIAMPLAHVGGVPLEEAIGSFGPALLAGVGVAWAGLRARLPRPGARKRTCTGCATHPRGLRSRHNEVAR